MQLTTAAYCLVRLPSNTSGGGYCIGINEVCHWLYSWTFLRCPLVRIAYRLVLD